MLTFLLVKNALSAQTRLKRFIRFSDGQICGQVSTLAAMMDYLKRQAVAAVLIDLPTQEEAQLSALIPLAQDVPDTLFVFWVPAQSKLKSHLSNVTCCPRGLPLDKTLKQIAAEAPALFLRSPKLKAWMEQSRQIDRAKQLLIQRGMSEDEAHHALEKTAMNERISRNEAALRILKEKE